MGPTAKLPEEPTVWWGGLLGPSFTFAAISREADRWT